MKSIMLAAFAAIALLPMLAVADHHRHCCPQCGCHSVKKVCKLVPTVEKVPETKYSAKCEDFCVPGPSCLLGTKVTKDCDGCHREKIWKPSCGCVRTRSVMIKEVVMKEKPGFKCVVETVCCKCGCCCDEKADQPGCVQTP
jgi:hypothetical protein